MDRVFIRLVVLLRIMCGQRCFAQHVVRITIAARFVVTAVGECVVDGLAGHELVAEHAHCEIDTLANQRFATLRDQPGHGRCQALFAIGRYQLAGDQQAPCCRIDEQRWRLAQMPAPVALADLIGDQAVGRLMIGNAQQRFGQAHQCNTLFGRQRKFMHQRIDTGCARAFGAHGVNQLVCQRVSCLL